MKSPLARKRPAFSAAVAALLGTVVGAPAFAQVGQATPEYGATGSSISRGYSSGASTGSMETRGPATGYSTVYPRQVITTTPSPTVTPYSPYSSYFPGSIAAPYSPVTGYNMLVPYGVGNGIGGYGGTTTTTNSNNYSGYGGYGGYSGWYPNTVISLGGYDYSSYCEDADVEGVLPTVYGVYIGFPLYFFDPTAVVFGDQTTVFDDGQFYQYGYDPFSQTNVDALNARDAAAAQQSGGTPSALPYGLRTSLRQIAAGWKSGNASGINSMVPQSDPISVGFNGQYSYSIAPKDYKLMTADALQRVATTDFRYTGVTLTPSGAAIAYAVQTYQVPTTHAPATAYLAYTLRRDQNAPSGWAVTGLTTSRNPSPVASSRK
jgi:hypothetical protein